MEPKWFRTTHTQRYIFPSHQCGSFSMNQLTFWRGSGSVNHGLSSTFLQLEGLVHREVMVISFGGFNRGNQWQRLATVCKCFSDQRYAIEELRFFYVSGLVRCHFQIQRSPLDILKWVGCPLRYLSWENMQIWNLEFRAFVTPYNVLSLQRLRWLETRVCSSSLLT